MSGASFNGRAEDFLAAEAEADEMRERGQCPECRQQGTWTRYGCAECGAQPFPPSHAYWDETAGMFRPLKTEALQLPSPDHGLTTPVHDEIVGWLLDYLREYYPDKELTEEFPIPSKDPLTAPSVDVYAPELGLAFEIKSSIPSCGELLRQIRRYEAALPWCKCPPFYGQKVHSIEEMLMHITSERAMMALHSGPPPKFDERPYAHAIPRFVVVSPDARYLERITAAGYLFLEYPSRNWHQP